MAFLISGRLYYLSSVAPEKVVGKYVSIGRVDVAVTRLRSLLHNPDRTLDVAIEMVSFSVYDESGLSSDERKKIADLLFSCYLQRVLASPLDSVRSISQNISLLL